MFFINIIYHRFFFIKIGYIITCMFFLSACSSKKDTLFYVKTDKKTKNKPVYIIEQGIDSIYHLQDQVILPGDILKLRNLRNETQILGYQSTGGISNVNISNEYVVEKDSTVALPFLGLVKLGGKKILDAEKHLNNLYSINLIKDPFIKISITNLEVTVLGEFNKTGNIPLNVDRVHLTKILGLANGLNYRANIRKIKIIRGDLKNPDILIVNLNDLKSLADDRLYLHNHDIIIAETKSSYRILDKITDSRTLIGLATSLLAVFVVIDRINN